MRKSYFKRKHELRKTVPICEAADIQLNELFKQYKKNAQVQYKRRFHSDLRTMRSKKNKEYWKLLNEQNKDVQNSHIDKDIFTKFFSELNSVKISNAVYTPRYLNNEMLLSTHSHGPC